MNFNKNYYNILCVTNESTEKEIKNQIDFLARWKKVFGQRGQL